MSSTEQNYSHALAPLPTREASLPVVVAAAPWNPDLVEDEVEQSSLVVSPRMVWDAFRRHWFVISLLWVFGSAAIVTAIYLLVKPKYDAFAYLKVDSDQPTLKRERSQQNIVLFQNTQVKLLSSPDVIAAAIAEGKLGSLPLLANSEDPESEIRKLLNVSVEEGTELINISMSSQDPAEAVKIINAVAKQFVTASNNWTNGDTKEKVALLEKEIAQQDKKLTSAREKVKRFSKENKTISSETLKQSQEVSIETYQAKRDRLAQVELEIRKLQRRLDDSAAIAEQPLRPNHPSISNEQLRELVEGEPDVVQASTAYGSALGKLKQAESIARQPADDPAYQTAFSIAQGRKKSLEAARVRARSRILRSIKAEIEPKIVDRSAEIQQEIVDLGLEKEHLEGQLNKMNIEAKASGQSEAELAYAKKDEESALSVFEELQRQKIALEFEQKLPQRITLIQPAKMSPVPQSNKRKMMMGAAPFGLLMALLGFFTLIEAASARVVTPSDITQRHAHESHRRGAAAAQASHPPRQGRRTPRARAPRVRSERRPPPRQPLLGTAYRRKEVKCVMITSACGSEGKTTLASQLAIRCANAGLMTLLIDADMRNPSLSKMLDVPQGPGLVDTLRGEVDAEAATVVISEAGGFSLLPSGTAELDPSRLLQGPQFGDMIARLRDSYDLIIVDAPPVLPVPDALTLGRWVDGAVLAVRYDASRFPLVKEAQRRLAGVGVPLLGAVVNGVKDSHAGAYGYYNKKEDVVKTAETQSVELQTATQA